MLCACVCVFVCVCVCARAYVCVGSVVAFVGIHTSLSSARYQKKIVDFANKKKNVICSNLR